MKVLYVFPYASNQDIIPAFASDVHDGKAPDTLLMGLERLANEGISASTVQHRNSPLSAGWLPFGNKRWDLFRDLQILLSIRSYDLCVIKDLGAAPLLSLLKRFHLLSAPTVYLDLVVSESTPLKRALGWLAGGAEAVVYCSPGLREILKNELRLPESLIHFIPWSVDTDFWRPSGLKGRPNARPLILSAGFNDRDFGTLASGMTGLNVSVEIATSRNMNFSGQNGIVHILRPEELRSAYERADAVVVPLFHNPSASGVTTLLEAMAMAKTAVVTETPATRFYTDGGKYAILVPPDDPEKLREAIERVVSNPEFCERLGGRAREFVEANFSTSRQALLLANLYRRVHSGD